MPCTRGLITSSLYLIIYNDKIFIDNFSIKAPPECQTFILILELRPPYIRVNCLASIYANRLAIELSTLPPFHRKSEKEARETLCSQYNKIDTIVRRRRR